ncbi:helix-turn-helix domain-containing protein [Bradyrhizobium sp. Arg314]
MFAIQADAVGANGSWLPSQCRPQNPTGRQPRRQEIIVSLVEADCGSSAAPISLSRADAFIVAVSLPEHLEGRAELGTVRFVDLRLTQPHHHNVPRSIQFYFPRPALTAVAEENGYCPVESLGCEPSFDAADDTLCRLAIALEPALLRPREASLLFVGNVARAAVVHFIARFADRKTAEIRRGGLAPWQLKRAREMLECNLEREISLPEIAAQCRLSTRHFSRAFSQSTGIPPQRWLMRHRVETAKGLLLEPQLTIAEVAKNVGFADQSHMTRVFSEWVGESPGSWRRGNYTGPSELGAHF